MNSPADRAAQGGEEISLLDLLLVFAENARLLIFGSLGVGVVALAIAFAVPPTFTATAKILPPQQQQATTSLLANQLGALSGLVGPSSLALKNPSDLYVALLKSRTIADRIIERFDLMTLYEEDFRQSAREELASRTQISAGKDGLIAIAVDDRDPKRAAEIANAYVEELTKMNGNLAITEAQQRRVFFEKQLRAAQDDLNNAQAALTGAGVSENVIKATPETAVERIARLSAQVSAQQVKLSTMRSYLTEQSPEFRLAAQELASLQAELAKLERSDLSKGGNRADYLQRYRDFKYRETLFELMVKQYEAARIDEAREGAIIQVVDSAIPPELKSKPSRALVALLSAIVAGMLLTVFLFFREAIRNASDQGEMSRKLQRIVSGLRRAFGRNA